MEGGRALHLVNREEPSHGMNGAPAHWKPWNERGPQFTGADMFLQYCANEMALEWLAQVIIEIGSSR